MMWLSIYLPRLALEVSARGGRSDRPVALEAAERGTLFSCNEAASARGLHPGLSLSAAFAIVGDLCVVKRDEAAEHSALKALAAWAGQFTSMVSLAPPQSLLLEIRGSERLFGGRASLLARVRAGLDGLGYTTRLAVAPTPLGAELLARAGRGRGLTASRSRLIEELSKIPLEAMPLEARVMAELRGMGLRTLGDCCRMPRDGLARRVGPQTIVLLDRALGKIPDPRTPYSPPVKFDRELLLPAEASGVEALLFAIRRLLLELSGMLTALGGGASHLDIELLHRGRPPTCLGLGLTAPSRDAEHLLGLARERLERTHLDAAVERISLRVHKIVPLDALNLDIFERPGERGQDWQSLVDRLRARLGEHAVVGLCEVAEHRPERACELGDRLVACQTRETTQGRRPLPASFRPLWLLREPQRLKTRDGKPSLGQVLCLEDPAERIESGWWDGRDVARDYFVARHDDGARYWLFRERRPPHRWYLHGIFS